jgi:sortase B
MKDGTMFGSLRNYKQKSYAQEHNSLLISYETKDIGFRIVAAALVDLYDANRFVYEEIPVTEEEIVTYLAEMKKHALWYEDFAWESGKKIVLLSTCDYGSEEERLVVFAIEK